MVKSSYNFTILYTLPPMEEGIKMHSIWYIIGRFNKFLFLTKLSSTSIEPKRQNNCPSLVGRLFINRANITNPISLFQIGPDLGFVPIYTYVSPDLWFLYYRRRIFHSIFTKFDEVFPFICIGFGNKNYAVNK